MNDFISALQKEGLKNVVAAADGSSLIGHLNTGNLALNWIISKRFYGGWPLGHVSEIFGDPKTGKSFLIARAIAESHKHLKSVSFLDDTENALNKEWARDTLGIDVARLAYNDPPSHTIEEHYAAVEAFIKASKSLKVTDPSVLALDSLALLSTALEVEQKMDKVNMDTAKQIRKMLRLCAIFLADLPAAYLITNHSIANVGDIFNPKTTRGGTGVKFQATVRLELRSPVRMKGPNAGEFVGVKINPFVEANRLTAPWRQCSIIIPFFEPISPVSGLVDLLLRLKALTTTAARSPTLVYNEQDTQIPAHKSDFWKQDHSALDLLSKHPTLLKDLESDPTFGVPKSGTQMKAEDEAPEEEPAT